MKLHKMFAIALACLTVGSVLVSSGRADMVTVYSNDFQTSAGSEWFYPSIVSAPLPEDGSRRFLGEWGPADWWWDYDCTSVVLTLGEMEPHSLVTLNFDLYVMHSWDGNCDISGDGPDWWKLTMNDSLVLLFTTFNNNPFYFNGQYPYQSQSFSGLGDALPDTYTGSILTTPLYQGQTGAVEIGTLGYTSTYPDIGTVPADAVYHMSFTVPDTSSTVVFDFRSSARSNHDYPPDAERWGLDNVVVTIDAMPTGADSNTWGSIKALFR